MPENNSPKIAMAAPAALFIVGCISFGIFALLTEWVPGTAIKVLVMWTSVAGIAIIICGVIEMARNDVMLGSLILVSGTLLALGGGLGFYSSTQMLPVEIWEDGLAMCGWVWLGIALSMFLMLPAAAKVSWGMFGSNIILGAAAFLLAIGLMQRVGFGDGIVMISGYLFLIYGIYSLYTATAFLTNSIYGKKKLPV